MNAEHLCKLQDITCVSATPFQSHYEARTMLPLEDVLNDTFFNNVRDNLWVGDEIVLCRYDKITGNRQGVRLVEFCTVRVCEKTTAGVKLFVVQAPVKVEERIAAAAAEAASRENYIAGNGEVRWNPGRKAYDIVCDGKVIVSDVPRDRKEWAQAVARGDEPLPPPVAETQAAA